MRCRRTYLRFQAESFYSRDVVRIEDAYQDAQYDTKLAISGEWRRMLGVPMLLEGKPVGALVVGRAESGPIPNFQEDLLRTFADQAVIAIENTRLFNENRRGSGRGVGTANCDCEKQSSRSSPDGRAASVATQSQDER